MSQVEIVREIDRTMAIWECPRADHSCGVIVELHRRRSELDKVWSWDRNESSPTLTPSVNCDPANNPALCGWHGFITGGTLTPQEGL